MRVAGELLLLKKSRQSNLQQLDFPREVFLSCGRPRGYSLQA
jgi:hypothetical protein